MFVSLHQSYCFYLRSVHLIISIVDLYLCQQPPILYYYYSALLVQCQVSTQQASNSYISFSLSTTYRQRASQLISLGISPLYRALTPYIYLVPYIYFSIQRIFSSTKQPYTITALYIAVILIYRSSSSTTALHSSTACSILLQAPIILYRHWFYSLANSVRALFASTLPPSPRPQIWEPYSIIRLITAVYSRRICLKEGPHIKAAIYNAAENAAVPLQVTYIIYLFQFSLKSTQTPRILRVASSFTLQPQIFTIKAKYHGTVLTRTIS